jgi:hypothetical protein
MMMMKAVRRVLLLALLVCVLVVAVVAKSGTPEQIALNYGASSSEMVVMWAVSSGNVSGGVVQFGTDPDSLVNVASATTTSYSSLLYKSPVFYKATMTGLAAGNQQYYYRVGSPTSGYSSVYSFKSHPGVGTAGVTFHLMGDPGQTENTQATLNEMLTAEHSLTGPSGGIFNMGDLSYANSVEPRWDDFGNFRQFIATEVPMLSTVGNHEWTEELYSFDAYLNRFDNPPVNGKRELYYSVDVGLAHWVMVTGYCKETKVSSVMPCLNDGTDQRAWLMNDLASVDRSVTPWVFVVFHQPYMNSNTHHDIASEGESMQHAIEDILYNGKVDVVFSGHVHAYERSCQSYKYSCTAGAPYYITIGDGGNAEGLALPWVEPQPAWSLYRQASYGFGELTVTNATHASWAWHQNQDLFPTVADSFEFVKGSAAYLASSKPVTGEPVFASSKRGERAAAVNERRSQIAKANAELNSRR